MIADARESLVAAALTLSAAVATATFENPVPAALIHEFRDADRALADAMAAHQRPRPPAVLAVATFEVEPGEDGSTVVLSHARGRVTLEPDRARGLAAALTAAAGHIDRPRELRRRSDVGQELLEREG